MSTWSGPIPWWSASSKPQWRGTCPENSCGWVPHPSRVLVFAARVGKHEPCPTLEGPALKIRRDSPLCSPRHAVITTEAKRSGGIHGCIFMVSDEPRSMFDCSCDGSLPPDSAETAYSELFFLGARTSSHGRSWRRAHRSEDQGVLRWRFSRINSGRSSGDWRERPSSPRFQRCRGCAAQAAELPQT